MGFKFTLEVVLRLRESLEEREFQELEKIQFEIVKTLNTIQAIDVQREEATQLRFKALASGVTAVDLQGLCSTESALDRSKAQVAEKLKELRLKRTEQFETYKQAKINREILSELRSQQKEAYDQKISVAAQKQIDDLFISRRSRN